MKLDIGCGSQKREGWLGMDIRKSDIVHDAEDFPYPFPADFFEGVRMSHLWEHIQPKNRIKLMDEIWRITATGGVLEISAPYAGSFGASQDPTHYPCPNKATFLYFDPREYLYEIYKPKPWNIVDVDWDKDKDITVNLRKVEP